VDASLSTGERQVNGGRGLRHAVWTSSRRSGEPGRADSRAGDRRPRPDAHRGPVQGPAL